MGTECPEFLLSYIASFYYMEYQEIGKKEKPLCQTTDTYLCTCLFCMMLINGHIMDYSTKTYQIHYLYNHQYCVWTVLCVYTNIYNNISNKLTIIYPND